jgi:DNA-binding transcriptional LysR family regulator
MTEDQLKSFITIADNGSISKAENVMFISKQALKKQLDTLEDELGFKLFRRSTNGVELTPAGEEFYSGVTQMLTEFKELKYRSQKLAFNEELIRIEVPNHPRLMLEGAFLEFSRLYPNIRQQIILQSRNNLVDDILSNRADIAECIYNPDLLQRGIACTKLFTMSYRCLISPAHPLADKDSLCIEDLSGNHIGLLERNTKLGEQIVATSQDVSLETFSRNSIQSIYNICNNNGVFISKAYYIKYMSPLIAIPLKTDIVPIAAVIYHENPSPIIKNFLEVIKKCYPTADVV